MADPKRKQVIPYDVVNEGIVVIGCAQLSPDDRRHLCRRIKPDAFQDTRHRAIWTALQELARKGLAYAPATLQQLGGAALDLEYMATLQSVHGQVQNLDHHVQALEWDSRRIAAAMGPLAKLVQLMSDATAPQADVAAAAREVGVALANARSSIVRSTSQVRVETIKLVHEVRTGTTAYPFGLDGVDYFEDGKPRIIPGCAPGLFTAVVGLPGSGKSTVVKSVVVKQIEQGKRVLYGSWEMPRQVAFREIAAERLGIDRSRFAHGCQDPITDDEQALLDEEMSALEEFVIFCDMPAEHDGKREVNRRRLDQIHQAIVETGADVFVADLWKRMLVETDPAEEDKALVYQQAICQDTKCHMIAVQQLRAKDLEARADKRPTREGIKGAGGWIEVPDHILGVHRHGLWKNLPDDKLEIIVMKQRFGPWPLLVEFDWSAVAGTVTNGRSVKFEHVENDLDAFISERGSHRARR